MPRPVPKLTGSARECVTSPWIEARGSVLLALPFSSKKSLPYVKSMMFWLSAAVEAPVRVIGTFTLLKSTSDAHGALVQVCIVRVTVKGGSWVVLLPRRRTSAVAPFSTLGPSGWSLLALLATEVQVPALLGQKSQ